MAALAFIAVLIILLLILTVMVHMRNRKLKRTLEEQMAERRILDKICADFTAVYYVELNTGSFEILHINDGTNVKKMNLKQGDNFNSSADQYAVQYLYEKERQEFKDWISTGHLKEQLSRKERITYHYRSKPNPNQHEFFEAQAAKIYEDEKHFFALVGFRHIDDIMEKETTIQNQLKQALDEARLSNEIISAIAKSYCSIYRIDVQKDFITGALANTQAQANVAHLAETARAHAQAGHWMFFTRDTHQDNYLTTREGRSLPIEHCIEGEDGWNFAPELENVMADTEPEVCHIVDKPTFGSYMLPSEILDELMAHNKAVEDIEKIVIYGYCTDICVISNAMVLRAAFPETEIEVLSDCCAGVTPQSHQTALDAMRACQFTII